MKTFDLKGEKKPSYYSRFMMMSFEQINIGLLKMLVNLVFITNQYLVIYVIILWMFEKRTFQVGSHLHCTEDTCIGAPRPLSVRRDN